MADYESLQKIAAAVVEDLTAAGKAVATAESCTGGWIAKTDPRLHRAYLLKEGLRFVFAVKGDAGKNALDRWLSWARRSSYD